MGGVGRGGVGVGISCSIPQWWTGGAPVSFWSRTGTVVHTATGTDTVVVGDASAMVGTEVLRVVGDGRVEGALVTTGIASAAKIGVGTATVPHAGVGSGLVAIEGAHNSLLSGPHVQLTTAGDNYPCFSAFVWAHDDTYLSFDAYIDSGGWKSSDPATNFQIGKYSSKLRLRYDSGNAQGSSVSWNDGLTLDAAGLVTVPGAVAIGGTVAATGSVRLANNTVCMAARNAANSADISVIGTNASDNVEILGSSGVVFRSADVLFYGRPIYPNFNLSSYAIVGDLRHGNATVMMAFRNAANTANIEVVQSDSSNNIQIGGSADMGALDLRCASGNAVYLRAGSSAKMALDDTAVYMYTPMGLQSYTVAGLPSAASYTACIAYCTNETDGAVPVFSDGTNWRRVTDRAIAS